MQKEIEELKRERKRMLDTIGGISLDLRVLKVALIQESIDPARARIQQKINMAAHSMFRAQNYLTDVNEKIRVRNIRLHESLCKKNKKRSGLSA